MKRVLSVSLAVVLLLSLIPAGAVELAITAKAATSGYYTYEVCDGEACITDVDKSIRGAVTIPSTLGGYPVTYIGSDTFYNCDALTAVTIPGSVVTIGSNTFQSCDALTSVTIQEGVEKITSDAFRWCPSLSSVTIPGSLVSIGAFCFTNCNLDSITVASGNPVYSSEGNCLVDTRGGGYLLAGTNSSTIPAYGSVKRIEPLAFSGRRELTSITIPHGVTTIYESAFEGCVSLRSVMLPTSVISIWNYTFGGCDALTDVYYSGTEADRANIFSYDDGWNDGSGNEPFINATWHYGVTSDVGYYNYTVENGKATIAEVSSSLSGNVAIPATLGGYPVTTIGEHAFSSRGKITSVIIPDGVTTIESGAFMECHAMTSVVIPDSVTAIGGSAFLGCSVLKRVVIPDSVTSIGGWAFNACTALEEITLPAGITRIEENTFGYCISLKEVVIPDSVTRIEEYAFDNCELLAKVTLPAGLKTIDDHAFSWCLYLTDVYYGGYYKDISIGTDNTGLIAAKWHYNFPHDYAGDCDTVCDECGETRTADPHVSRVTAGNYYQFTNSSVAPFTLSNGVYQSTNKSHSASAVAKFTMLYDCEFTIEYRTSTEDGWDYLYINRNAVTLVKTSGETEWTTLNIQAKAGDKIYFEYRKDYSVSQNEDTVYFKMPNTAEVMMPSEDTEPTCTGAVVCAMCRETLKPAHGHNYNTNNICTVCGNVIDVSYYTYTVSGGVAMITDVNTAISGDITLPLTLGGYPVTGIGSHAFYQCDKITSVVIPQGVKGIGTQAFSGCTALQSVSIPPSITGINGYAFNGCSSLKAVHITDVAAWCNITFVEGSTTNPITLAHNLYLNGELVTDLVIPQGVTHIADQAFMECDSFTSLTIPSSVTSIGKIAFYNCNSLTAVTIPQGVKTIEYGTFAYCHSLTEVTFSQGVESIGSNAFVYCNALTSLTIPASVKSIEDSAFASCHSLNSVVMQEGLTNIGEFAFYDCQALESIVLPQGIRTVGAQAFSGCTALQSVSIPPSLTNMGAFAFLNCNALDAVYITDLTAWCNINFAEGSTTNPLSQQADLYLNGTLVTDLVIPQGITHIHNLAFRGCTSIRSVTFPEGVAVIGAETFAHCYSLTSVIIPSSLTSVGKWAFASCDTLANVYYNGTAAERENITGGEENQDLVNATWHYGCDYTHRTVVDAQAATCLEDGYTGDTLCADCGMTVVVGEVIPAAGHTAVIDAAVPPTCTEAGLTAGSHCDVCGIVLTAQETDPATGHTEVTDEAVAPTCTETGLTAGSHCDVCGTVLTAQETIPTTAHTEVIDEAVAPTCAETGLTAGSHCDVCGTVLTAQETVPTTAHTEVIDEAIAPTCMQTGRTAGSHCDVCGTVITAQKRIPVIDHIYANGACTMCGRTQTYFFTVADGAATITGRNVELSGAITVPSTLGGYPVTAIGENVFKDCTAIKSVTLPNTITAIDASAFDGCTGLTGVYITDLSAWCRITFANASANPLYNANWLYVNGTALNTLVIPADITEVKDYAFVNCTSIHSLTIPSNVKRIGVQAFRNSTRMTSITFEAGVESIGAYAFNYCMYVASIALPEGLVEIGDAAFMQVSSLKTLTLPLSLKTVGGNAFYKCSQITDVYYGGLESEREGITFGGNNSKVTDATWHYATCTHENTTVTGYVAPTCFAEGYTGDSVCGRCGETVATGTAIPATGHQYGEDNLCDFCGLDMYLDYYTYTVENGVATITDVDESISGNVVVPSTLGGYPVTAIGEKAFRNCVSITAVTVPDCITHIGGYAFASCLTLTSVHLGAGVASIGDAVFSSCVELATVTVDENNAVYHSRDNCVIHTQSKVLVVGCKSSVIPNDGSVTSIGDFVFYAVKFTEIAIPASVQTIGQWAFGNCNQLMTLTIPRSVKTIGYAAFYKCTALCELVLPNSIRSIGESAFAGCTALADVYYGGNENDRASVTIAKENASLINAVWHYTVCEHRETTVEGYVAPTCTADGYMGDTVCTECGATVAEGEVIPTADHQYGGDNVCDNCGNDKNMAYYTYTITDGAVTITKVATAICDHVVIPDTIEGYPVTAIGNNAFKGRVNITELTIPASITKIGDYAFRNCTALTTVHYNAANATHGAAVYLAFNGCTALTTVYIGKEVQQVPANAFRGVTTLKTLYLTKNTTVIGVNAFYQTALSDVYYVGMTSDWANVDVKSYNTILDDAVFSYNFPCFQEHDWTADCDSLCDLCNLKRATTHANIVEDAAVAPTCEASGLTAGSHCSVCGNVIEAQRYVPALGHTWDAGEVLVAPTAGANGSKLYTCTVCGSTKTVVLTTAEIRDGYYYVNGVKRPNAGLVMVEDAYYYVGSTAAIAVGRYAVSNVNDLPFERGIYYFFPNGKMNTTVGVYEGYYFNENGKLTAYAGLIEWNGAKYYVNNGGAVNAGGYFYISNLNGLIPRSCFRTFYADGRMLEETRIYDVDGYYYENGTRTPYAGMVEYEGHWYYVNDGGAYMKNRVQVLVNVNNSGLAKNRRCYFNTDGHMVYNTVVNGVFFGADGMAPDYAGVVKDNEGNLYYVNGVHGAVRKNATFSITAAKANGLCAAGKYTADATGKLSPA